MAFNRKIDATVATSVNEVFTEVVLAPDFDEAALEIFKTKKNVRVLKCLAEPLRDSDSSRLEYKQISGGFLVQEQDIFNVLSEDIKIVSQQPPSTEQLHAMMLAWKVCKHVKSNAIVLANEHQTVESGPGK